MIPYNPNTETIVALRMTTNPKGQAFYFANGLRISRDQYNSLDGARDTRHDLTTREEPDGTHRSDFYVVHEVQHVYAVIGRKRWWSAAY